MAERPKVWIGIFVLNFSSSYDTWVHAADLEAEVEDPPIPEKPWKVSLCCALDSSGVAVDSEQCPHPHPRGNCL